MGICVGNSSRIIDDALQQDKQQQQHQHNIIILGTKSSGKTALMNQLDYIYNIKHIDDFTDMDATHHRFLSHKSKILIHAINDIRQNCVNNIILLCDIINDKTSIQSLQKLSIQNDNDLPRISDIIATIWSKQNVKTNYNLRYFYNDYIMDDNMDHFFDKISEIMTMNYTPSINDVIMHRSYIHFAQDISITIRNSLFRVTDLGTIKSELLYKHIHLFESIHGVIFVAALNGYCVHNEWFDKLAMIESVESFDVVANSRYFSNVDVILLLNKNDIFMNCIKQCISLKNCFGDDCNVMEYENVKLPLVAWYLCRDMQKCINIGIPKDVVELIVVYLQVYIGELNEEQYFNACYMESVDYVKQQYLNRNQRGYGHVYTHIITAIDPIKTFKEFDYIQHFLVTQSGPHRGLI
eukprot:189739_1